MLSSISPRQFELGRVLLQRVFIFRGNPLSIAPRRCNISGDPHLLRGATRGPIQDDVARSFISNCHDLTVGNPRCLSSRSAKAETPLVPFLLDVIQVKASRTCRMTAIIPMKMISRSPFVRRVSESRALFPAAFRHRPGLQRSRAG